ncbi:paraquat-inducible protein A [Tranquillimonas alkanivorans]|uniref:Paraquat-inducible protein A n=1 Tax=Tranquillimonas alkanivorans TaxID=441119 RepID=A0A1I5MCQ8_9RHOB|nr:paraquat-inducible protein A [Tranquillimonas alkanivorans]SFP07384.1 paraquat-inducible protein A [Tranquillimonas alkanivorans]
MHTLDTSDLSKLIACPSCDALYSEVRPGHGRRAVCERCHTVLISPRRNAGLQVIALSTAAVILVIGATIFPFLQINVAGMSNSATVLDAAMAFAGGPLLALSLAVTALIVLLPLIRLLLILYVLTPIVFDRPPARRAKRAFRMAEQLKPWSMAEIFALGCAVSLIKVADLARIEFGPAFWMFLGLVVIIVVQDAFICRWSVWKSLEERRRP